MFYETCCSETTTENWNRLMKGSRKASYRHLIRRIKRELPDLYANLGLNFPNPYEHLTRQTKTHYILVHSTIEYFIHK